MHSYCSLPYQPYHSRFRTETLEKGYHRDCHALIGEYVLSMHTVNECI